MGFFLIQFSSSNQSEDVVYIIVSPCVQVLLVAVSFFFFFERRWRCARTSLSNDVIAFQYVHLEKTGNTSTLFWRHSRPRWCQVHSLSVVGTETYEPVVYSTLYLTHDRPCYSLISILLVLCFDSCSTRLKNLSMSYRENMQCMRSNMTLVYLPGMWFVLSLSLSY